jgi:glycosyltransferase involved in cell wall biosynthesis
MTGPVAPPAVRPRLIVFSDDWGRHVSSSQHLARELLAEYQIDWIHTIGTRRPRMHWRDVRRSFGKLREWSVGAKRTDVPDGLRLHAPVMWPGFRGAVARGANARMLDRCLRRVLASGPEPVALITTVPLVADVARRHGHRRWIYYCVDALDQWTGLDGPVLRAMELELLRYTTAVVATSQPLVERLCADGADPVLITHGVDLEQWRVPRAPRERRVRPQALFWGCANERLDAATCLALAEHTDLHLVGRVDGAPPALLDDPRIVFEPALPQDQLPLRAAAADVLVMPYNHSPATLALQPLKLKEYLATGLPTVVTDLPAIAPWSDALDVAADPGAFVASVLARAGAPLPEAQVAARQRLARESWRTKAREFAAVIELPRSRATVLDVRCASGAGTGPDKTILRGERYLRPSGYRCLTALLHDPTDPGFPTLLAAAAAEGCTVIPVPDRGPLDRSVFAQLLAICRREKVRIWHGHDYKSDLLGLLVRRHHGMHLVTTVHGRGHDTWKTPLYHALDRSSMRRYDRVLAVSAATLHECRGFGVRAEQLRLLPNAIEVERVPLAPRVARRTLRIGAVGRLAPEKGLLDLFTAVRSLRQEGIAVEVVVFGEGPQRGELERWIAQHAPAGGFALAGHELDRDRIYRDLDVFVLASAREGLPNALLEAMASALPVVATEVGGVGEVVQHGTNGLLCPPQRPDRLAALLRSLLADAALRARIGDAARQRVASEYSFAVRMARLAAIYDELDVAGEIRSAASAVRQLRS